MLLGFAALAYWARARTVLPGDLRFARWVQGLELPLLGLLTDATNWSMSGVPLTIIGLTIVAALFVTGRRLDAAMLSLLLILRLVNGILKRVIESPRPSDDLIEVAGQFNGFGYPSGHASGAMLIIGGSAWILARHERRRTVRIGIWTLAVIWIGMTGIARVRVGAHWPTDMLGAWLWSVPVLMVATRLVRQTERV